MKSRHQRSTHAARAGRFAWAVLLVLALAGAAQADVEPAAMAEARTFRVTGFAPLYDREDPQLPALAELSRLELELGREAGRWVAPLAGRTLRPLRLEDVSDAVPASLSGGALRSINEQLVAELRRRGLRGVLVMPHEDDVDPRDGRDLRPPGRTRMRLRIRVGRVGELHTWSWGSRAGQEGRADHPLHERIARASPVQPGDLPRQDAIDAYVSRLNRHPGRRVDSVLAAGEEAGEVDLHYRVVESRPLRAWVGGSNSGTRSTTRWRQRFGLLHGQLTNRDDLLRLDYVTGSFDELNAVFGRYEAPLPGLRRLRLALRGSWSEYDASELGRQLLRFDGEQWDAGGELALELFQHRDLFLDWVVGAAWKEVEAVERPVLRVGDSSFFLPELGLRLERRVPDSSLELAVSGLFNLPGVAGTRGRDLPLLGRPGVSDASFQILHWSLRASAFLDALAFRLLDADRRTLAHEIALEANGQSSLGTPLVPQFQGILGGAATVRGYEQSIVAGDTVVLGRAEYRLHLPRILGRRAPLTLPGFGAFRVAPDEAGGLPDWDLVLRAFVDAGISRVETAFAGERRETLVGAGPGVELQIGGHLSLRLDLGVALSQVRNGALARPGDTFLHFSGSLVY